MAYFFPEAVDSWTDLIENNNVTVASWSLRSKAEEIRKIIRTLREQFNIIEESLQKLSRIKSIIEKKNRTFAEKRELINYVIENCPDVDVQRWLNLNADSEDFFHLVNLFNLVKQKVEQEEKKRGRKGGRIDLVFLAHGAIESRMIPASFLQPLTSITDVLLYSPWNCLLSAEAAYSIATGVIQLLHRIFECSDPNLCCNPDIDHQPFSLPNYWNSMRNSGNNYVPNIMVSPVGAPDDKAFEDFIALEKEFGPPAAHRYLIPYLHPGFGRVPFFTVTLALSVVLHVLENEATVHLAACLGKTSPETMMEENYLNGQYAYTVNNTGMSIHKNTLNGCSLALLAFFWTDEDQHTPTVTD
ncbi:hypothetical protein CRENBAI_008104 [Crenichthys baileyi]|uniref:Uncharacterized protein n=1 Tax=Crenichthys baileyi TaxID=28760 RepID=A0AAV9RFZ5_9TELE